MRKSTVRQYAEAYLDAATEVPVGERLTVANRFVRMLVRQRQLRLVPRIVASLERLIAERGGPIVVKVRSAKPLGAEADGKLSENLERTLGRSVKLRHVHDSKLLAGAKIQVGDRLVDNSLASRLASLKTHLLES